MVRFTPASTPRGMIRNMTGYHRGRNFEYRVRDHLIDQGYEVLRSAGSKTKVDLVGIKTGELLFLQCKLTDGQISPGERSSLRRTASLVGATPLVAWRSPKHGGGILFRTLTGDGPRDWIPWSVDHCLQDTTLVP